MSAPTAVELTALLGALQAAAADWREATWNMASCEFDSLDAADDARRAASIEYGEAVRDMEQAIARLAATEVAR
jgi:hypothetical protein